jgi:hypothetical protein
MKAGQEAAKEEVKATPAPAQPVRPFRRQMPTALFNMSSYKNAQANKEEKSEKTEGENK